MILNFDQRIFEAAAKDAGRYAMHGILFRTEGDVTTATATNGKILTRIEVTLQDGEVLPEDGVLLSSSDIKAGWGRGKGDRILRVLEGGWKLGVGNQISTIDVLEGEFPQVEAVIPDSSSGRRITFDAKLLLELAKSAGTEVVTLEVPEFQDSGKQKGQVTGAIRVQLRDSGSDNDLGVIMPVVVE